MRLLGLDRAARGPHVHRQLYSFGTAISLASVSFPASLTHIGNFAFNGTTSLASVSFPEGLTSIGNGAFNGTTSLESVSFPESLTSIGIMAFAGATSLVSVFSPEGLTSIGAQAFLNTLLTEADVTLPASLGEEKRHWYYYNCMGYTDLVLPEGLTTIGDGAFSVCDSLLSVALPRPGQPHVHR